MAQKLRQTAEGIEELYETSSKGETPLSRIARRILAERRKFEERFGAALFADPARDILLDLFAAGEEGKRISVSSCCVAAAVPATTALRHINALRAGGLVGQSPDPNDGRRIYLELASHARAAMEQHLREYGGFES